MNIKDTEIHLIYVINLYFNLPRECMDVKITPFLSMYSMYLFSEYVLTGKKTPHSKTLGGANPNIGAIHHKI